MPSLLSRFLGKKKNTDQPALLDGEKFEAVSKSTSPSAATFAESTQRPKSKETEQSPKGQGKRQKPPSSNGKHESKLAESVPVLSLSLPGSKGEDKRSSGLGVVFEGITDAPTKLDEDTIGEKRLTPSETLTLVQKTSEVINERGLDTLGVMRPHWFASPRQQEIQLKLIDRFLRTLSPQQANGSSSSSQATFESELRYSGDPHDIAAVLRWGLRHLQLEQNEFGSSGAGEWYRTFADSERSGSYSVKAFDDILLPLLPAAHAQLLRATLEMVSSLAAHSEENGISGNKLSKVLGWWIVSSRNIQGSNWKEFYAQWEVAARQFEHLFLAYVRAQQAQSRMPKRLTELVKNYPFAKNQREGDGVYLPRPQFSTRSADALFVRITADKSGTTSRLHPLRVVEDAFRANADSKTTGEYVAIWEEIRKIASKDQTKENDRTGERTEDSAPALNLSSILADESIRLLSLVPTPDGVGAPTISLFTPLPAGRGRRSLSVGDRSPTTPTTNGRIQTFAADSTSHNKAATSPPTSYDGTTDWQLFSSSGFESPSGLSLAASLWDNDTEVTQPNPKRSFGAVRRTLSIRSASSRRGSVDLPAPTRPAADSTVGGKPGQLTYGAPRLVRLDEAFIDFWADSLLDPIARTWPTFVVCQLKSVPAFRVKEDSKPIEWLIIERTTPEPTRPPPVIVKPSSASARAASPVQSSPTGSDRGKSSRWGAPSLGATRKRWSFFSPKHESAPAVQGGRDRAAKKAAKDPKVGEMGEILREEDEGKPNGVKVNGVTKVAALKEAEKPQKAVPPPPTIQINGVSKPTEPATATPEKTPASGNNEPLAVAAEPTPVQGLPAVAEGAKAPTQVAEVAASHPDTQQTPSGSETTPKASPNVEHTSPTQAVPEPSPATSAPAEHTPAPVSESEDKGISGVAPELQPVVADTEEPRTPVEAAQVITHGEQDGDAPHALPSPSKEPEPAPPSQTEASSAVPEPENTLAESQPEDTANEAAVPAPVEHAEGSGSRPGRAGVAPEVETTSDASTLHEPVEEAVAHSASSAPAPTEPAEQTSEDGKSQAQVLATDPPPEEPVEEPTTAPTPSHDDVQDEPAQEEQPSISEPGHVEPASTAHDEVTNAETAVPAPTEPESEVPHNIENPAIAKSEPHVSAEDATEAEAENHTTEPHD